MKAIISPQKYSLCQIARGSVPLLTSVPAFCRFQQQVRPAASLVNFELFAASAGCTALFIVALWKAGWQIERLSANPLVGPQAAALAAVGSRVSAKIVEDSQWWRLVTSLFVSSGQHTSLLFSCAMKLSCTQSAVD